MTDRAAIEREYKDAQLAFSAAAETFRRAEQALEDAEDQFNQAIEREQRAAEAMHALPYEPALTTKDDGDA